MAPLPVATAAAASCTTLRPAVAWKAPSFSTTTPLSSTSRPAVRLRPPPATPPLLIRPSTTAPALRVMSLLAVSVTDVPAASCVLMAAALTVKSPLPVPGRVSEPVRPSITRLSGSSSRWPPRPALPRASTSPEKPSRCRPDTSTWPPVPAPPPPWAWMRPANSVSPVDHSTAWPPRPLSAVALTSTTAPACMSTWRACNKGPLPCQPPPTNTWPPACWPCASRRAPGNKVTWPAVASMVPPKAPEASAVPPIDRRVPLSPRSEISPGAVDTDVALTAPLRLITLSSTRCTVAALSSTWPPPAMIWPLWSTRAASAWPCTSFSSASDWASSTMLIRRSPARSSTKASPAASATRPRWAWITPLLATCGPSKATRPPSATVIRPSLRTLAPGLPRPLKLKRPAMKSVSDSEAVLATRPPTSTCAVRPKRMPLGLSSTTCPLALMRPKMADGSWPSTRLSVTALELGCTNCTVSCAPTLNERQSMAARWLDCVMVVCAPCCWICAWPVVTRPASGAACASGRHSMDASTRWATGDNSAGKEGASARAMHDRAGRRMRMRSCFMGCPDRWAFRNRCPSPQTRGPCHCLG